MKPYLAIGPLSLPTYGVFYFSSFAVFAAAMALFLRRRGANAGAAVDLAILMALGYTMGARVLAVLAGGEWAFFTRFPAKLEGALWGGQAAFGAAALVYILVTRAAPALGDALAVCWAGATVMHKLGCFFAGCCEGSETTLPWAVTFAPGSLASRTGVPLHPTQLYDAGFALMAGVALAIALARGKARGRLLLWWGLAFAITRFATEWTRGEVRFPIADSVSAAMLAEALALVVCLALLIHPAPWDRIAALRDHRAGGAVLPDAASSRRAFAATLGDALLAAVIAGVALAVTRSPAAPLAAWLACYLVPNVVFGAGLAGRALGISSVRVGGEKAGVARRFLRGLTDALAPITWIAVLRPLLDRAGRTLGDAVSGTTPVRVT